MGLGLGCEIFLPDILKIVDLSCGAIYEMSNNINEKDYIEELKKVIIEVYACLTFAITTQKCNKQLFDHYTTIGSFIVKTCDPKVNPTIVSMR